ncbi:MAG: hypothetical protein WB797_04245 [Nocardioides sp.]
MSAYDDDHLVARLRAADPASSLPPADPGEVAQLLEVVMSDTTTRTPESRENGTHDRSPLTWLVAAAAVALILASGVFALVNRDHDATPSAGQTVTQLDLPASHGRCEPPNVGVLRLQTIAFRGTVTSLDSGTATFRVEHWFKGGPTDLARVSAPPSQLSSLVSAVRLRVGGSYLLAAHDGIVTECGFTGPDTGRLAALYSRAFAG